jgi:hypothetical protein
MWPRIKLWLTAAALGVGGMVLLLLVIGMLSNRTDGPVAPNPESPQGTASSDDSCSFRIFGSVTDESGEPIQGVTISLRGDGPFATSNRNAITNSTGRFVFLDPTNRYREWTRSEPVTNDEQLRVVLEPR